MILCDHCNAFLLKNNDIDNGTRSILLYLKENIEGPLQFQTEKFEQEHQIGSGVHNLTIVITDFQILAKY